jgi:hypothetical protein
MARRVVRRRRTRPGGYRRRRARTLLWVVVLALLLIVLLSLLFGGFRKGGKVGGIGPAPTHIVALASAQSRTQPGPPGSIPARGI